ncbi:MAG: ABC transporter ATP-binding protein [candidate division Zixibacteria bacterium]|nr:ABC transporter ATP-binding protein [candidate division Zixibacteria bacterium]
MSNNEIILNGTGLSKSFASNAGFSLFSKSQVKALQDVDITIHRGEKIGLIGRSGSGKSTLIRCLAKLITPDKGRIFFMGKDVTSMPLKQFKNMRKYIQVIFQNNYSALNPGMKIREMLHETAKLSGYNNGIDQLIEGQMDKVSLSTALLERYPRELSGGECRRIGIAMIDLISPDLLLADEPVTALDYINKWEILSLFEKLNKEKNLALLIATHDLEAMLEIVNRVIVMYGGIIVEMLPIEQLWECCHPHTVELVRYHGFLKNKLTVDVLSSYNSKTKDLSAESIKTGCVFVNNCQRYQILGKPEICREKQPPLTDNGNEHKTACYFYNKVEE